MTDETHEAAIGALLSEEDFELPTELDSGGQSGPVQSGSDGSPITFYFVVFLALALAFFLLFRYVLAA